MPIERPTGSSHAICISFFIINKLRCFYCELHARESAADGFYGLPLISRTSLRHSKSLALRPGGRTGCRLGFDLSRARSPPCWAFRPRHGRSQCCASGTWRHSIRRHASRSRAGGSPGHSPTCCPRIAGRRAPGEPGAAPHRPPHCADHVNPFPFLGEEDRSVAISGFTMPRRERAIATAGR